MIRYYKATKLLQHPYIQWESVAEFATTEDFENSEWAADPLVKPRSEIIPVFGTYPYHVVDGVFVDRTEEEMEDIEAAFNLRNAIATDRAKASALDGFKFDYDGNSFPMDASSRLFYSTFPYVTGSQKIRNLSGEMYTLIEDNFNGFLIAFYTKLNDFTKHTFE